MNGWIVMARCPIDEIPMGLEKDEINAVKLANILTVEDVLSRAATLNLDTSDVICICILEFRNGQPKGGYKLIRNMEDE